MARFRLLLLLPAFLLTFPGPARAQVDPTLPTVGSAENWESFPYLGWTTRPFFATYGDRLLAYRADDLIWQKENLAPLAEWTGETWIPSDIDLPEEPRSFQVLDDRLVVVDRSHAVHVRLPDGNWNSASLDSLLEGNFHYPDFGATVGNLSYLLFAYADRALAFDGHSWDTVPLPPPLEIGGIRNVVAAEGHQDRLYCAVQSPLSGYANELFRLDNGVWTAIDSTQEAILDLIDVQGTLYAFTRRPGTPYYLYDYGLATLGSGGLEPVAGFPHSLDSQGDIYPGTFYQAVAHGDGLVVRGSFDRLPDDTPADDFAVWRNGAWEPLDPAGSAALERFADESLLVWRDRLIIAGNWSGVPDLMTAENGTWRSLQDPPLFLVGAPSRAFVRPSSDRLVVVGAFTGGGQPGVMERVCEYDGSTWTRLGEFDGLIVAINELDGDLVIGGALREMDGVPVDNVARLGSSGWEAMGDGLDAFVFALTVHAGSLVAGGAFDRSGDTEVQSVAVWTGVQWSPLGRGFPGGGNDSVVGFVEYDGKLVAHGSMKWIGNEATDGIAAWDGGSWRSLAARNRFGGAIRSAAVSPDGTLWVGGTFGSLDGRPAGGLARFDGVEWTPVVAPRFLEPTRLIFLGNTLAVTGDIRGYRNQTPLLLLRNGEWLDPLAPRENFAEDAVLWRGRVVFCLGRGELPQLAAWTPPEDLQAAPAPPGLLAYPNPSRTVARFRFTLNAGGPARLTLHDLLGREVRVLAESVTGAGSHVLQWNLLDAQGRRVAPGVYFARLQEPTGTATRKLLVLP